MKEKYEEKLTKELSGPTYEVLGKVMKVIINRKLTGPGHFLGYEILNLMREGNFYQLLKKLIL